jgi:hypothetical protein
MLPFRRQCACASTRRTTLWWMCSWRAMVPISNYSPPFW